MAGGAAGAAWVQRTVSSSAHHLRRLPKHMLHPSFSDPRRPRVHAVPQPPPVSTLDCCSFHGCFFASAAGTVEAPGSSSKPQTLKLYSAPAKPGKWARHRGAAATVCVSSYLTDAWNRVASESSHFSVRHCRYMWPGWPLLTPPPPGEGAAPPTSGHAKWRGHSRTCA